MKFLRLLGIAAGIGALSFIGGLFLFDVAMKIFVGKGDEKLVPEVTGLSAVAATEILEESGLYLVVEHSVFDAESDSGEVLVQRPIAGERVKTGRRIHVVVSQGAERLVVPSVAGQRVRQAKIALSRSGLTAASIAAIHHDEVGRDVVIASSPVAGAPVTEGEAVGLLVSLGPEPASYLMPDLRGKREQEVRRHLNIFGLGLSRVTYRESEKSQPGVVLSQTPPPGSRVDPRTSVEVEVVSP